MQYLLHMLPPLNFTSLVAFAAVMRYKKKSRSTKGISILGMQQLINKYRQSRAINLISRTHTLLPLYRWHYAAHAMGGPIIYVHANNQTNEMVFYWMMYTQEHVQYLALSST